MNAWQCSRQLAYLLSTRTWPDAPNEVVFSRVVATASPREGAVATLRPPCALVRPLDATSDRDDPRLKLQRFELALVVAHAGDALGEEALVGGHRASVGSSRGRGLLEVEEQALAVVDFLNQSNSVRVQAVTASEAEAVLLEGLGYVAVRALTLEALLTTARSYPPPNAGKPLTATTPGGGQATLAWALPATRFDLHAAAPATGALVLRRAAGATPPASEAAGVGVTIAAFATGVTDTPGAGQVSYALFAGYDEGVTTRYSTAATKTVTAV